MMTTGEGENEALSDLTVAMLRTYGADLAELE
jgi:hypothetical protein